MVPEHASVSRALDSIAVTAAPFPASVHLLEVNRWRERFGEGLNHVSIFPDG